jgi:hypothetical protein
MVHTGTGISVVFMENPRQNHPLFANPKKIEKMSDPLVWQCVKNHNSFLRKQGVNPKRGGMMTFSAERGNLMSLNSYKYSGLANSKQIQLTHVKSNVSGKEKKRIVMGLKTAKKANKPAKFTASTVVKSWAPKEAKQVIGSQVIKSFFSLVVFTAFHNI